LIETLISNDGVEQCVLIKCARYAASSFYANMSAETRPLGAIPAPSAENMKMRTLFNYSALAGIVLLAFSAAAAAQGSNQNTVYDKINIGPGGPAPPRDLNGTWVGPVPGKTGGDVPQLTPLGQQRFSLNKPEAKFKVSGTNDPFVRMCDPLGFPRNMLFEMRSVPLGEMLGMTFASLPQRLLVLSQFQRVWREIWTDGRELPTNVGSRQTGAPDPRYYGYSVGHWEADNVFVVDTVGLDDSTWLNKAGYPHTVESHVQERYTREDHNDLQLTITVDDPKLYTKPFVLATNSFKWLPDQNLGEQLCIPSQVVEYLRIIGDPAK
jgi:hypothetical protein